MMEGNSGDSSSENGHTEPLLPPPPLPSPPVATTGINGRRRGDSATTTTTTSFPPPLPPATASPSGPLQGQISQRFEGRSSLCISPGCLRLVACACGSVSGRAQSSLVQRKTPPVRAPCARRASEGHSCSFPARACTPDVSIACAPQRRDSGPSSPPSSARLGVPWRVALPRSKLRAPRLRRPARYPHRQSPLQRGTNQNVEKQTNLFHASLSPRQTSRTTLLPRGASIKGGGD